MPPPLNLERYQTEIRLSFDVLPIYIEYPPIGDAMTWSHISTPPDALPPRPITMRAQSIPPRHEFPEHAHDWHQVVYAIDGVLMVTAESRSFVISPDQAVWLPSGVRHRVGSLLGAEFRSLWIAVEAGRNLPSAPTLLAVSPLLKALIVEAAAIEGREHGDGYPDRVATLILDQLGKAQALTAGLPWPRGERLLRLCEALYIDPADTRSSDDWARMLGMSSRTLTRQFEAEMGSSLRSWRRRLRLLRAIELLSSGTGVTETAMQLGYGSASAFIFAFRTEMGSSPHAYMRSVAGTRPGPPRKPPGSARRSRSAA
ncbi:AraC family transcriptional regulator [Bradyrhizobium macuxiense]|uniref:AraC family transcriptional regulator n=1 Tax=Bradyrhizobium macuxiense TaxID=1755647 RepID=UPI000A882E42|nr:helix-turn-helix transcriptional regulator [Bradyrhizobium macuxiense]